MCTWEYDIEMCPQCGIGHKINYHLLITCTYVCPYCHNNNNKKSKRRRPETCPRFESHRSTRTPIREMARRCADCLEAEREERVRRGRVGAWVGQLGTWK